MLAFRLSRARSQRSFTFMNCKKIALSGTLILGQEILVGQILAIFQSNFIEIKFWRMFVLVFSDHKHFNKIISASLRFLHAACEVPMHNITFRVATLVPAFSLLSLYGSNVAALQKKVYSPNGYVRRPLRHCIKQRKSMCKHIFYVNKNRK